MKGLVFHHSNSWRILWLTVYCIVTKFRSWYKYLNHPSISLKRKYPYKEIYQNDAMNLGRFKFTRDETFQNAFVVRIECTSNLKVSLYGHKIVMLLHLKVVCSQTSHYICFKWNYKLYTKFQASPWSPFNKAFFFIFSYYNHLNSDTILMG